MGVRSEGTDINNNNNNNNRCPTIFNINIYIFPSNQHGLAAVSRSPTGQRSHGSVDKLYDDSRIVVM